MMRGLIAIGYSLCYFIATTAVDHQYVQQGTEHMCYDGMHGYNDCDTNHSYN